MDVSELHDDCVNAKLTLDVFRYIFLIFGSISITWGIIFLSFMPDIPSKARFLSPQERVIAVERVAANRQGVKNHHFKWYQARQAARDPKTWILFIMAVSVLECIVTA
jgi:hypothetical protein